jgi:ABC-type phosphate transport system auxiliary subunit
MVHATLTSKMQTIHQKIAKLEQENIEMIDSNKQLAQRMLVLANDASAEKIEEVMDARLRKQLQTLEEECLRARREWRVLKSVVVGIVAGSGVDWATDPKLLEVVLDEEDELG